MKHKGLRVMVVFEGRDGAGKGGTIRAITERVSPRVFRVVALSAPTDREKTQMYMQRYMAHFPAAGEIVIFGPQLVQPRRGRTCHGLLPPRNSTKASSNSVPTVEGYITRGRDRPDQVLARGEQ